MPEESTVANTEGAATEAPAAAAPESQVTSSETPKELSPTETMRAHMESQNTVVDDPDGSKAALDTDENKDTKDKNIPPKEDEQKEVSIDPETLSFLEEQKIDMGDLTSNETAMNIVKQLRESKAENTKIVNQNRMTDVALAKKRSEKAADNILESESGSVEPPLSPVKQAEVDFNNNLQNMMKMSGYDNIDQLAVDNPELAQSIVNQWTQMEKDAMLKEYDWHKDQDNKAQTLVDDQKRVDDEFTAVKSTASDRIKEAEKLYPKLSEELKGSGADEMMDQLAEITNVPSEYFAANEKFFNFFAKAAHAITVVNDMPNIEKDLKGKMEKELYKTKLNESVATGDPLPEDHKKVAVKYSSYGHGTKF